MKKRTVSSPLWLSGFLLLYSLTANAGGNMAMPVRVVAATQIELAPTRLIPGTVIGRFDSRISAEVEGRIESLVDIGDQVEEGDVIARIDDSTFRMQVNEARAQIVPLEARLKFLKREVQRLEKLARQNNAARNQLEEMISNRDEARGELQVRQSQLVMAQDKFNRTTIHAPFAGVVTQRFKTEGEWASAGDEIVRLVNTKKLEIQARVPIESANLITPGDVLQVEDREKTIQARVITLVPVGDDLSRLYELRLDFEPGNWMSGHAVRVAIPTGNSRQVIAVPRDALVIRKDSLVVYRIKADDTAEIVPVTTGIAHDDLIEVKGTINAGDRIVIRGNERLRPQQKVMVDQGSPET